MMGIVMIGWVGRESERVLVQLVHGILWWSTLSPNNLNIHCRVRYWLYCWVWVCRSIVGVWTLFGWWWRAGGGGGDGDGVEFWQEGR